MRCRAVVRKRPNVLTSTRIHSNVSWLQKQLGKPTNQLRGLLYKCPALLLLPIDGEQWAAKLDAMEAAGIDRFTALDEYSSYLKSSLPTIAACLAFWRECGSPEPLNFGKLLTSQHRLDYLETTEANWEAFQRRYFASEEWHQLCARHDELKGDDVVAAWRRSLGRKARGEQ